MTVLQTALHDVQQRVVEQIQQQLSSLNIAHDRLDQAMNYGVLNGGKRLRPFLVYATCEALGGKREWADSAAVALEMIHSYSLVHDDLPAMDDDDLRRGKPTCHIAFDEATAILAGDGLLTAAFEVLALAPHQNDSQRIQLIKLLANAAGGAGMVAGQSIDLNNVGKAMSLAELENMHQHKTGALIRVAVQMGAICSGVELSETVKAALITYAEAVGLAFQVWDDILDVEGDSAILGKNSGVDAAHNKPTYPALLGLEGARSKAHKLIAQAHAALAQIDGDNAVLAALADYVISRDH